jgi:hypothetical protein
MDDGGGGAIMPGAAEGTAVSVGIDRRAWVPKPESDMGWCFRANSSPRSLSTVRVVGSRNLVAPSPNSAISRASMILAFV